MASVKTSKVNPKYKRKYRVKNRAANERGLRDRALLLFGFASAMRRSELVALDLADLEETERGLLVTVRRSKSDQEAKGHQRAIPFGRNPEMCPVKALRSWIAKAQLESGRVFRSIDRHGNVASSMSTRAVADVVKSHAKRAGFPDRDNLQLIAGRHTAGYRF